MNANSFDFFFILKLLTPIQIVKSTANSLHFRICQTTQNIRHTALRRRHRCLIVVTQSLYVHSARLKGVEFGKLEISFSSVLCVSVHRNHAHTRAHYIRQRANVNDCVLCVSHLMGSRSRMCIVHWRFCCFSYVYCYSSDDAQVRQHHRHRAVCCDYYEWAGVLPTCACVVLVARVCVPTCPCAVTVRASGILMSKQHTEQAMTLRCVSQEIGIYDVWILCVYAHMLGWHSCCPIAFISLWDSIEINGKSNAILRNPMKKGVQLLSITLSVA